MLLNVNHEHDNIISVNNPRKLQIFFLQLQTFFDYKTHCLLTQVKSTSFQAARKLQRL